MENLELNQLKFAMLFQTIQLQMDHLSCRSDFELKRKEFKPIYSLTIN